MENPIVDSDNESMDDLEKIVFGESSQKLLDSIDLIASETKQDDNFKSLEYVIDTAGLNNEKNILKREKFDNLLWYDPDDENFE